MYREGRMIHGIYGTRFTSNGQDIGGGIVVIDGISIHGGDPDYLYKGQYWLQGNHRIEAIVNVQNYTGRLNALVGHLSSFELTLSGMAEPKLMRLSGSVNGQRHRTIQIALTKISDLVDPSMGCFDAACAIVAGTDLETPCTVTHRTRRSSGRMERSEVKPPRRNSRNR